MATTGRLELPGILPDNSRLNTNMTDSLKNFGVPLTGGIQLSLLSYYFAVDVGGFPRIRQNVTNISVNLVAKQLALGIRETINGEMIQLIEEMIDPKDIISLTWESFDGEREIVFKQVFVGLKLVGHEFEQAYSKSAGSEHHLQFEYSSRTRT